MHALFSFVAFKIDVVASRLSDKDIKYIKFTLLTGKL